MKFLFVPIDAVGHVNAMIGVGQALVERGHSVTFGVSQSWVGKLTPLGFSERCFQDEQKEEPSLEKWGEMVKTMSPALAMPPLAKLEHFNSNIYRQLIQNAKDSDAKLRQIVEEIQPDLIMVDAIYNPALSDSGYPWVCLTSINPIGLAVDNVAPAFSGYSSMNPDYTLWDEYRKKQREVLQPIFEEFQAWILEKGGSALRYDDRSIWTRDSPYANLYMFPQELDYHIHRPYPPNFHQFDALVRSDPKHFEIPAKLKNLPGKLVYVSLGSIGCSELQLMNKLIAICAKSPHRFIISKGPLGDQLELGDNMWGANSLPQTNVLPLVDLVITHGGNNTITESFHFGTKVLVLPLFCDQADNGQRVTEMGLGLHFDPYQVTEQELLQGIEILLADDMLEKRMKTISTRIKAANNIKRAADLLENVARSNMRVAF